MNVRIRAMNLIITVITITTITNDIADMNSSSVGLIPITIVRACENIAIINMHTKITNTLVIRVLSNALIVVYDCLYIARLLRSEVYSSLAEVMLEY